MKEIMTYGKSYHFVLDNALIAAGGEGGMAVVIDCLTSIIAKMVDPKMLMEYVQACELKLWEYIPKRGRTPDRDFNEKGLAFGTPEILITQ
jgi:hypothetical protein